MYDLTARKTVDEVSVAGGVRYVAARSGICWQENQVRDSNQQYSGHLILQTFSKLRAFRGVAPDLTQVWSQNGVYVAFMSKHNARALRNRPGAVPATRIPN